MLLYLHNDTRLNSNIIPFHILYSSPLIEDIHRLYSDTPNHIHKQLNHQPVNSKHHWNLISLVAGII